METRLQRLRRLNARTSPIIGRSSGDTADDGTTAWPAAGFKAGRRKRGVSPLKRKPKTTVTVKTYDVTDSRGNIIAENVFMITKKVR